MPLRPKFGRVTLSGKELGVRRRVESESARFSYRYWLFCSRYGAIRLRVEVKSLSTSLAAS